MKKSLFLIVYFFASALLANEAISPSKSGRYDIGGFTLYLECFGNKKPTLILEQGFGRYGSDGVWSDNIVRLSTHFSICLYDRSGLGKSEQGPIPFTVNDMALRLNKLLRQADIKPPYYFAGHSYGAFVIQAYNNLYPTHVKGAVLIDPPPLGYFYTMGSRWPDNFQSSNKDLMKQYQFEQSVYDPLFNGIPENVDHMKSYDQLVKAKNFLNKPITILRAKPRNGQYDEDFVPDNIAKPMNVLWQNADNYFRSLSSNSNVVYANSPKHHLHITEPDLVVTSIKELLKQ